MLDVSAGLEALEKFQNLSIGILLALDVLQLLDPETLLVEFEERGISLLELCLAQNFLFINHFQFSLLLRSFQTEQLVFQGHSVARAVTHRFWV